MFNWLSKWFPGHLRQHAPHLEAVAVHNSFTWNNPMTGHSQTYAQSPWVYVAVSRIAEACALVPLKVYRLRGEERIEVNRHPLEVLLEAPNPYTSRFELFEQTVGMLELTGNAYWLLVGNEVGTPTQIWTLRPDRIRIVPDSRRYVKGYVYEIDGQMIPLDALEVVHFKRWHPYNDYFGLSALEAARLAITTDRAMSEWNHNTFGRDNGVPAGIVNIKDFISDSDFQRIKREWRQSYGGPQRKTAFLRGGSLEWHDIGLSHTDLDFLQGRKANRDEILSIFGVPVGLVSENATEANAKVAERLFIERTLYPKLARLAQKITQTLLPFYPGQFIAEFEDIRPTDQQARLDEIRAAKPILSINEIRERYFHMPPVDWGEKPAGTPEPQPIPLTGDEDTEPMPAIKSEADHILTELAQWERYALKRFGKVAARPFETHAVPDEVAFEVKAGLLAARTEDDARQVFVLAREAFKETHQQAVETAAIQASP